jgi:hypothetical protein
MKRRRWLPEWNIDYYLFRRSHGFEGDSVDGLDLDAALADHSEVGSRSDGKQSSRVGRPLDAGEGGGLSDAILPDRLFHDNIYRPIYGIN